MITFDAIILHAQTTITLNPVKDNTLYESTTGSLSNGSGEHLFFGKTGQVSGAIRRALLKFDVSGNIPSGSTITNASLRVTVNRTVSGSQNADLYRVSADWGEGTSNDSGEEGNGVAASTNDATWLHTFHPDELWTNAGGDFISEATASISVGATGNYTWTSAQLIADVQNWLDSPGSNFGWVILGNESESKTAKRIASRENATASARPVLSITYTPPCIDPELPELSVVPLSICQGQSTTLTASGNLNSATAWHIYTGSCGTTSLGSEIDGIFVLNPGVTTTYYVRGEGGCVTPGTCTQIEVEVVPYEDPSFSYDLSVYCQSDGNPIPDIIGTSGGTFKSTPAGLVINSVTGEIDLASSIADIEYTITYTTPGAQCADSSDVTISIIEAFEESATASICNGDQYFFGTQTLTTEGVYSETFQSAGGCDSSVTLTLNVIQDSPYVFSDSICEGDEFMLGSQLLSAPGTYYETFQSSAGCDSLVTLNLVVNTVYVDTLEYTICEGESIVFDQTMLAQAGTYPFKYQTSSGCDSTVIVSLIVNPLESPVFSYDSEIFCRLAANPTPNITGTAGGTFSSSPAGLVVDSLSGEIDISSGVTGVQYTVTYTTPGNQCPSSSSVMISIIESFEISSAVSICNGEQYTLGSQVLTTEGTYEETFQTAGGCDSIVTLTLSVIQGSPYEFNTSVCDGDEFILGSQTLSEPGTYSELFISSAGCDSLVTLHLTVHPVYSDSLTRAICQGESFDFGLQTLTSAGTYVEIFESVSGCDSVITLQLKVNPVYQDSIDITLCAGDSLNFGSQILTVPGNYSQTYKSSEGCDSTVNLTLNVIYIDTTITHEGIALISNEPDADYQWIHCLNDFSPVPGETGISFEPFESGNYAVIVTKEGCVDTSSCSQVTILNVNDSRMENNILIYPNPAKGFINIDMGDYGSESVTVIITDIHGNRLSEISFRDQAIIRLDLHEFTAGVYFLGLKYSDGTVVFKLIKP
ncbi:MAG TPA: DNRLRE domain-containing protein [Cyclobacteriaceae bacterium]|nr:DNRLRE domain-containing protein [Cyclobacteriaceae bacterium]